MYNPFKKSKPKAEKKSEKPEVRGDLSPKASKASSLKSDRSTAPNFTAIPHLTEKAMSGSTRGWYTFRVPMSANKITVKEVIQSQYGVKVRRVSVLRRREKKVKIGRIEGRGPKFKKATVKLAAGESINFS